MDVVADLDGAEDEGVVDFFCAMELVGIAECDWDGPDNVGLETETTFLVITRLTTGAFTVA